MKKLSLLISLIFILIGQTQSQVLISLLLGDDLNSDKLEFGLEGGGNFSKIGNLGNNKFLPDWNIGFYFDITIKENKPWNFYTGVLVKSRLGATNLSEYDILNLSDKAIYKETGTYSQKIKTFIIPVFLKYKFNRHFYVEAGPQLGLMYKAWIEYEYETSDTYKLEKYYNTDNFNKIDYGFAAGTGYRFKGRTGWTVGIKYYYGLADAIKILDNSNNQSLFLKVNIPIGRSEAAQKRRLEKQKAREAKKLQKKNKKLNNN